MQSRRTASVLLSTLVLVVLAAVARPTPRAAPPPPDARDASVVGAPAPEPSDGAARRARPIAFAPNVGQAVDAVRFTAAGGGLLALCAADALWMRLVDAGPRARQEDADAPPRVRAAANVALRFADAAAGVAVSGEGASGEAVAFVGRGADRPTPTYAAVRYHDVREGVDVVVHGAHGALQYDVHVAPGADLSALVVELDGAGPLRATPDGGLAAPTAAGDFVQGRPSAFERDDDGAMRPLPSCFEILGPRSFRFAVDGRDPKRALVVDPVLSYATYLGGSGDDEAFAVATRYPSEAFVAGTTASADFPLTPGAVDPTLVGVDAFVARLSYDGSVAYFTTYFGGSGDEEALAIAVGDDGAIYLAGRTTSANLPVTPGAAQSALAGPEDGFVAKLAPAGAPLLFCTYVGGSGADAALACDLDPAGGVVVAGRTAGAGFPTTPGAYQPTSQGGVDAFVAEFAASNGALVASTRLGGSGDDVARGLVRDPATGETLVAGGTSSANFPTTAGAWLTSAPGGGDGFLCRVAAGGVGLAWSTYVGGSGADVATDAGLAYDGGAFVVGGTASADFPTTSGVVDASVDGEDVFVVALDPTGAVPVYATVFGGAGDDAATGLSVDGGLSAHVVGTTTSTDMETSVDAARASLLGASDGFYLKLSYDATLVDYATYLGGSGADAARAVVVDANGGVFVAGRTTAGFAATPGAYDPTFGGASDAFVWACVFCTAKPSVFNLGGGCGLPAPPVLTANNGLLGQPFVVSLAGAPPGTLVQLWASFASPGSFAVGPCVVHLDLNTLMFAGAKIADAAGAATFPWVVTPDSACCGLELTFQALVYAPVSAVVSNGLRTTFGG